MGHHNEDLRAANFKSTLDKHRHVLMPWTVQSRQGPPVIVRGEGPYFVDDTGRRILDFSSGWVATPLGHGHPEVIESIRQQLNKICWSPPSLAQDTRAEYAAALSDISPWSEGCRTHFTTGGGEANDDAVRIARMLTGRGKILVAYRSYHGNTQGSSALTGGQRRWASEPYLPGGVVRFWAPYPYRSPFDTDEPKEEVRRALNHLERVIVQENAASIAALILEPIVGSDGLIVYPDGYLAGLRELTVKYGILLVFDEVMTGFGRVGEAFAAIRFGVTPDMITFAKSSSAAYVPLGGVMVRESLAHEFDSKLFDVGHTHAGHPLAMAAALGALTAYKTGNLFKKAYEIERWITREFQRLAQRHPVIGDVRGKGAFFGLEVVRDRESREPVVPWQAKEPGVMRDFYRGLLDRGLWLHGKYSISVVAPPLIITEAQFKEGVEILDQSLGTLERELGISA